MGFAGNLEAATGKISVLIYFYLKPTANQEECYDVDFTADEHSHEAEKFPKPFSFI